jgi:hypothetical protein
MPRKGADRVAALFQVVHDIENQRPPTPEVQKMLDDTEAAERSAGGQLAAILAWNR